MNEAELKKLIELFCDSGIDELEYKKSFWRGTSIRIGRNRATEVVAPAYMPAAAPPAAAEPAAGAGEEAAPAEEVDPNHAVTSPMVGTFYHASSPEAEPFIRPGDRVQVGQTIGIIEAMKIMNEIEADMAGEVVEVAVDNASPVEYGQPLVKIRPA